MLAGAFTPASSMNFESARQFFDEIQITFREVNRSKTFLKPFAQTFAGSTAETRISDQAVDDLDVFAYRPGRQLGIFDQIRRGVEFGRARMFQSHDRLCGPHQVEY